ncbi:MAG TPA: hypothetical protein VFP84_00295 [Kofleriaceae bacterium]|nr:hypothetical protein [Kofleriaceae bacterium]
MISGWRGIEGGQGAVERGEHRVDLRAPGDQRVAVLAEHGGAARRIGRAGERRADLGERHADRAQHQHLVEPMHVVVVVQPVAGRGPLRRSDQADLVVVMERAHGHAGQSRKLAHCERHGSLDSSATLAAHAA